MRLVQTIVVIGAVLSPAAGHAFEQNVEDSGDDYGLIIDLHVVDAASLNALTPSIGFGDDGASVLIGDAAFSIDFAPDDAVASPASVELSQSDLRLRLLLNSGF